ncbi:MAG TPA: hypothetical protein VF006_27005 [Longimicrobium sp.]
MMIVGGVTAAVLGSRWLYAQDPRLVATVEAIGISGAVMVAAAAYAAAAASIRLLRRRAEPAAMLVGDERGRLEVPAERPAVEQVRQADPERRGPEVA